MQEKMSWADRPLWVRFALFGVPSRFAAKSWMVVTVMSAGLYLAGVLYLNSRLPHFDWLAAAIMTSAALIGFVAILCAALWYWLAIQYADEHGAWSKQ